MDIKTVEQTTSNGMPYTGKIYQRPGLSATAVVGDMESFGLRVDARMTFYPNEVREIAAALVELADWMDTCDRCGRGETCDCHVPYQSPTRQ